MEKFDRVSKTLMAHSAHLRGAGNFSDESRERCTITVTLSTGISKARTEVMNLKYLNPIEFKVFHYENYPEIFITIILVNFFTG